MDFAEYEKRSRAAEEILTPLFHAKFKNWEAQSIIDVLTQLFSLAKQNNWVPEDSRYIGKVPFFEYYASKIGHQILEATLTLSSEPLTEANFEKLDFRTCLKPKVPHLLPQQIKKIGRLEVTDGQQPPWQRATWVTLAERNKNQKIWNSLFDEVMFLNETAGLETYEDHPYSTYVFRYERLRFNDQVWRASKEGINHANFCEYVLRPLYFSTIYKVRSLVPYRVSAHQFQRAKKKNKDPEILPLISLCRYCLRPIKKSIGGRRTRSDTRFCPDTACKNDYHQKSNKPK